jgi:hypothetical protein
MVRGMPTRRATTRPIHHLGRRALFGFVPALAVAACGGTAATSPASTGTPAVTATPAAATPTAASSATPAASKGPATATLGVVGTAGLTGPITAQTIDCDRPALTGGPEIFFIGQAGANGPTIIVFLQAATMQVRVGTGAAATLRERDFTGTGVTDFNAATGAHLDSQLTETTDAATATGNLGALSSISGTIDCGDETAGTASIIVSGTTPFGQLAGTPLTGVDVTCTNTASGLFVGAIGLSTAGTTPVLVFVTASTGTLQVSIETGGAGSFYSGKGTGLTTLTANGAQMAGDVSVSVAAGATPSTQTVHVAGDDTCGIND